MPETGIDSPKNRCPELWSEFSDAIVAVEDFRGDLSVTVSPLKLKEIASFLKERLGFKFLMDLFGMDYSQCDPPMPERFAVIYNFYSYETRKRIRLKVFLDERDPAVDSLTEVFRTADWFEREAWDMFGIGFHGHPNLTRILTHHEFQGHPLRKDYPSDGYQRLKRAIPGAEL